jgi:hypothetical protein
MATSLILSLAVLALFQGQAPVEGLAAFSAAQQQTAKCMLSVVRGDRNAIGARLQSRSAQDGSVAPTTKTQLFIDYSYARDENRPLWSKADYRAAEFEITPYLSPRPDGKTNIIALSGISPVGAGPDHLNYSNNGLIGFIGAWHTKCGVNLFAITV